MLNINSEYKEPGYHASYLFDDLTDKVKVSGKVNNKKDGVYYLTYKVKGPFITVSTKRKVEVKDIERPVITLEGVMKLISVLIVNIKNWDIKLVTI